MLESSVALRLMTAAHTVYTLWKKEDAGEWDIYKINLLEGMLMAKKALAAVSKETIAHCWTHKKIQWSAISEDQNPSSDINKTSASSNIPLMDQKAWDIIQKFATLDMTLPLAEECLHHCKHLKIFCFRKCSKKP